MGFERYKRSPDGFRELVELWESTPVSRRQRMIEVGMDEDAEYAQLILSYMITFEDVLLLPDLELAELISTAPARIVALSICRAADDVKQRFKKNTMSRNMAELRDSLEELGEETPLRDIGGAQLKMIEFTRKLEKMGKIKTKRIPHGVTKKVEPSNED